MDYSDNTSHNNCVSKKTQVSGNVSKKKKSEVIQKYKMSVDEEIQPILQTKDLIDVGSPEKEEQKAGETFVSLQNSPAYVRNSELGPPNMPKSSPFDIGAQDYAI